ncbi:MAG: type II toxin-antitoxin system Phd/YefM family antitoxin [Acidimicrobiia bacterium]
MVTKVIPKTELRERIREELAQIGDDSLLITERGRPLAVVVSVTRWNDLQETIEDLEDTLAVLEHRSAPGRNRAAESVFSSVELEEADVPSPSHKTG